jgi:hypothetical protein
LVLLELLEVAQVVMVVMVETQLLVHWQLPMVAEVEQEPLLEVLLETQVVAVVVVLQQADHLAQAAAVLADQIIRMVLTGVQVARKAVLLQIVKFHLVALEF